MSLSVAISSFDPFSASSGSSFLCRSFRESFPSSCVEPVGDTWAAPMRTFSQQDIYIHTYIHTYIYMCVCVCIYVCIYVYMHIYTYIYIYVYIRIGVRVVSQDLQ